MIRPSPKKADHMGFFLSWLIDLLGRETGGVSIRPSRGRVRATGQVLSNLKLPNLTVRFSVRGWNHVIADNPFVLPNIALLP
jgi:hypothetical protein